MTPPTDGDSPNSPDLNRETIDEPTELDITEAILSHCDQPNEATDSAADEELNSNPYGV
ncbi:MAG: hypothetical protein U0792_02605 [Gemmataceae bacterium]